MPPKVKFSKEAMIGTALQLVREEGMASLTARALAEKLGATPRVIFGQFANMAELQAEVIVAAEMVVVEYIRKALEAVSYTHLDVYKRQTYDIRLQ